jgi:hypothetical protein
MSLTRFPHGVSSFGVPVLGAGPIVTTGNVFFVDDSGSNSNDGLSPDHPFVSLDYAVSRCTASHGDVVILMPGHAETTTAVGIDVAGVRVVGLGIGADRPTITATTGASDLLDVTAANCTLENFCLVGAASGVTALIDIAADDLTCINMKFSHGAAPVNAITVASGLRPRFYGCTWYGTANGPAYSVLFESATEQASKDFEFHNCVFNYGLYGLDSAAISNASNGTEEGGIIENCLFSGMDATAIDFNSSSSASIRGMMVNCLATATTGITIANIYDLASYGALHCDGIDAVAAGTGTSRLMIPSGTCS